MSVTGSHRLRLLTLLSLAALLTTGGLAVATSAGATTAPPAPSPSPSTSSPQAPTNLTATSVTSRSVTLTWTAAVPGCCPIARYRVLYRRAFDDTYRVAELGNVTTATITSYVTAATEYQFYVGAYDDQGHASNSSAPLAVVTPISDTGSDIVPPGAPVLQSSGVGPAGVALAWSAATDNVGVIAYDVYSFDGVFVSRLVATVTGTSYTAPQLSRFDSYYVRARDAAGNVSIASNRVVAGTETVAPPPPSSPPPSSPPASPSVSPMPPRPSCKVTYHLDNEWQGGFTSTVTVTNNGVATINGWKVGFTFAGDQRITQSWNGTWTQSGASATLTNAAWNGTLAPGAGASVGIFGTWGSSDAPPRAFLLNGAPCTTG